MANAYNHGLLEETDVRLPNHGKKMNRLKFYFAITFDKNGRLTYFFLQMKENLSDLTMKENNFQLMTGSCPNLAIP